MSDIEKSFTFLHDNIPSWLSNANEIESNVAQMQSEVAKMPVLKSTPTKRRTGSIESIRDLDGILEGPSTSNTTQQSLFASRKRKTRSVSSRASGPKYRSRAMIIVQYDGQVQKSFEALVRSIGTGRNMLRKGKMTARLEALAELAGPEDDDGDDSDDDALMSKIGYRHRTGLSAMRTRGAIRGGRGDTNSSSTPIELFDSTDKALEHAQGLCERAAHQSLRDGNCRKELDGVRKHFEEVLESARKEVARYNTQKEKEASLALAEPGVVSSLLPVEIPPPKTLLPSVRSAPATAHSTLKAVDIEVDDDEDDEIDFVMPPIRLTTRA